MLDHFLEYEEVGLYHKGYELFQLKNPTMRVLSDVCIMEIILFVDIRIPILLLDFLNVCPFDYTAVAVSGKVERP